MIKTGQFHSEQELNVRCVRPSTNAFAAFLRSLRKRIDRGAEYLGGYRRLPIRRGMQVSQEELAEAVNVSRNWYAILESGAKVRASTRLLGRIADVLMLSAAERAELFQLALPEVAHAGFPMLESTAQQPRAIEMLDAFRSLRRLGKTLWTATSEVEALTMVREHAAEQFDLDFTFTTTWAGPAMWDRPVTLGRRDSRARSERYYEFTLAQTDPQSRDHLFFTHALSQPGDIVTNANAPSSPSFAALFAEVSDYVGWRELDFLGLGSD